MRFAGYGMMLGAMLLAAGPAAAQAWNENGPSRDMLSNSMNQFDRLRREQQERRTVSVAPGYAGMPARAPIPMLDWAPPPPVPAPRPRAAPRRVVRSAPPVEQQAPIRQTGVDTGELERRLQDRQQELDRLRQQLDADRQRLQQLRGSTTPGG